MTLPAALFFFCLDGEERLRATILEVAAHSHSRPFPLIAEAAGV